MYKKRFRYSRIALTIAVICVLFCILYEWIFKQYEAPNNFVYSLGVVTNCVALSVIASCIFYFITDFFPKRHQQAMISQHLSTLFAELSSLGQEALKDIAGESVSNKEIFIQSCTQNLHSEFPESIRKKDYFKNDSIWFDYFETVSRIEKTLLKKIITFESNIPVEVKLSIEKLKCDNSLINNVQHAKDVYAGDSQKRTLAVYAEGLYEHITTLSYLKKLYQDTTSF